jgi:hypothetical protein
MLCLRGKGSCCDALSWLSKHNPVIDWKTSSFKFSRCDCIESKPFVEVIDISGKDKGEHEEDDEFNDAMMKKTMNMRTMMA